MDGHDYRLEKITEIQMNLEEQRLKRLELSENYYKAVKWVNNADVVLITLSMGLERRVWVFYQQLSLLIP